MSSVYSCQMVGSLYVHEMLALPLSRARATPSSGERKEAGAREIRLRDLVVLAVLAPEVAPDATQRIRQGAGQVMKKRFFLDWIDGFGAHEAIRGGIERPPLVLPHPADPVFPVGNRAAVAAQRALHRVFLFFCILPRFVHILSSRYGHLKRSFLLFSFPLAINRIVIHFKDKRSPVLTILAEIHLTHISPGNREDIAALADRTAQHSRDFLRTTLYEHPVQKLVQ